MSALARHPSRERFELRAATFVTEYLKDLNGKKACERMGIQGDCKQAAHAFLRDEFTQELIAGRMAGMFQQAAITQEAVLDEVASIAFSDPRAYFDALGNLKPISELTREQAAAIASVDVEEDILERDDGKQLQHIRKTRIKFWPKNDALEKLGRYLKIWEAAKVNLNVDARSVTVHQHASDSRTVQAVDRLIERCLQIGAPRDPAPVGANGSVLPAALHPESDGHGASLDARANP